MSILPLATSSWDENERMAIDAVLNSGMCSMGKCVEQCEQSFAAFVGSRYALMTNSGSSANLIAIAALFYCKGNPLKRGDEVIVPAVSWATTYSPLAQYGLKLRFIDIDKETLNVDLGQLKDAISDKTKAVLIVNLLGNPTDFKKLTEILDGRQIYLIEDNCESMGATFNEKQAGTFGVMGTYSTYFSHHICTIEGGFVVTDDEELYHIILSLRSHGWTRQLPQTNHVVKKTGHSFYDAFNFVLPGYNMRPNEIAGAIGTEQIKKLPQIIDGRRKNAKCFQHMIGSISGISIQQETCMSSWLGFAIIVEKGIEKRDELVQILSNNGVECRPIVAGNFTRNDVIKYYDYEIHGQLINSDLIHDCGFYIGNHHQDISVQLAEVAELLKISI